MRSPLPLTNSTSIFKTGSMRHSNSSPNFAHDTARDVVDRGSRVTGEPFPGSGIERIEAAKQHERGRRDRARCAVDDFEDETRTRFEQGAGLNALGPALRDDRTAARGHEVGIEAAGTGNHPRIGRHRLAHGQQRAAVVLREAAQRREAREPARRLHERRREDRNAAAVDGDAIGRKAIVERALAEREDLALHRMLGIEVTRERFAAQFRQRENPGMLARAVVVQRVRPAAALQIGHACADLRQNRCRGLEVPRFAHMRGAHHGQFARVKPEALDDARAHRGRRDERLRGRTQKHGHVGRPAFQQHRTRIVARTGSNVMRRFDACAAPNIDHRDARKLTAHVDSRSVNL